jgi:hypothetical protein
MSDQQLPVASRDIALAMLAALARSTAGIDRRTLEERTRSALRREGGTARRGDEPLDRIRRRLAATGAIARDRAGLWQITPRGMWMMANPDRWIPEDILPVTESEMRALRGYERLNAFAVAVTAVSCIVFFTDGQTTAVADRLHAFLRVVIAIGLGVFLPAIMLLASEHGSDWFALVTRRYRRAQTIADPASDRLPVVENVPRPADTSPT